MTEQATCTHEGAGTATYCPKCGKQLIDEGIERLRGVIRSDVETLLQSYGLKKKEAPKPGEEEDEPKTELDRILGKKKKK